MIDALIGKSVNGYTILERIGHGGMSEVFLAQRVDSDEPIALKLLHAFHADDPSFLYRFNREAEAMIALDHPNIVRVFDFDTQGNTPYIAMQYWDGGTLKDKFRQMRDLGRILSFDKSFRIVLEMADALAYAHSRSMIHRDIKPANILFAPDGRAILTDFGIVKTLNASTHHTQTGAMIGTPAYMSPEQGLGRPGDARSDVYALGVLFFQMVTGKLPYDADKPLAVVLKHINEPIPFPTAVNPNIPAPIELIIMKALAKNPLDRFQTADDMGNALRLVVRRSDDAWAKAIPAKVLVDKIQKPLPPPIPLFQEQSSTRPRLAEPTRIRHPKAKPKKRGKRLTQRPEPTHLTPAPAMTLPVPVPVATASNSGRLRLTLFLTLLTVVLVMVVSMINSNEEILRRLDGIFRSGGATATVEVTPDVPGTATAESAAATATAESIAATETAKPIAATATAAYQAGCYRVQLVRHYTYDDHTNLADAGQTFSITWVLRNDGSCPIEEGARFVFLSGAEFSHPGSIALRDTLQPNAETTVTATFHAPSSGGIYTSIWQVIDADGQPVGSPVAFSVMILEPTQSAEFIPPTPKPTTTPHVVVATNTPTPPPTNTPEPIVATRTPEPISEVTDSLDFNAFVQSCEYANTDWRCQLLIAPDGGSEGPYTITIYRDDKLIDEFPLVYSQTYLATAARCDAWTHEVRVLDTVTQQERSKFLYLDPNTAPIIDYLGGQCTIAE